MSRPLCQFLEWDSDFFGFRIGRLTAVPVNYEEWRSVDEWCKTERIRCLYLLAPTENTVPTAITVGEPAFQFVDIRVTLDRDACALPPAAGIRNSEEKDIPALRAIARESHTDSRFYADPNFPRERCDALYETWIEKSCRGYANQVLVAEREAKPAGYITCSWSEETGQIGLIAVAAWARGAGIGKALVRSSLGVFHEHGVKRIMVVTQGRNVQAQRLYQRCGFLTRSVQLWYHRWVLE